MYTITKFLPALFICLFAIACTSDEKEKQAQQPNVTNTAEAPLIAPNNDPLATTATAQTIYAVWVVDSMNNKALDSTYFAGKGKPYFDFNSEKQSLSGFTGCSGINGKLKVQGEKLIFDSLVVTSQECTVKDFEKKVVNGFRSGKTTYKIVNGNLQLNIGSGTTLILRKIS